MRGTGRSYPNPRQEPPQEQEPVQAAADSETLEESVGETSGHDEQDEQFAQGPDVMSPELSGSDAESSNDERVLRPNTFEQMIERLIERMNQPRQPALVIPTFLEIVMAMRNLGTEKFSGSTDPFKADAWLRRVEANFSATRCPDAYKRDVAVYYLDRDAANWWETLERRLGYCQTSEYAWIQFRAEFLKKYFPEEARDRLETQYMQLTQGERTVREYEAEFTRLR